MNERSMMSRWSAVLASSIALSCVSCGRGERQEAAQVVSAVDRFRKADNAGKPSAVEALRAVKCSAPDVCRARDTCLGSADATTKALTLKNEVERGIVAIEKGILSRDADEAQKLPAKLDEAEALLQEGFAALQPCDDHVMGLKRRYRL